MAISFNTAASNTADTASSVAVTIPAGVLTNDVMLLILEVFCETGTTPTIAFSGAGGGWNLISVSLGANPEVATAGSSIWSYGFAYSRVATAGVPGASLTITETGSAASTTWMGVSIAAYTGANTSTPVDVAGGSNFQGTNVSASFPARTTGVTGDWSVCMAAYGLPPLSALSAASLTKRTGGGVDGAGIGTGIWDSAASVGSSGTSIGGNAISGAAGGTDWYSLFTIGLAPAGAAPPPAQPRPATPLIVSAAVNRASNW
jgi:hypothetical protein